MASLRMKATPLRSHTPCTRNRKQRPRPHQHTDRNTCHKPHTTTILCYTSQCHAVQASTMLKLRTVPAFLCCLLYKQPLVLQLVVHASSASTRIVHPPPVCASTKKLHCGINRYHCTMHLHVRGEGFDTCGDRDAGVRLCDVVTGHGTSDTSSRACACVQVSAIGLGGRVVWRAKRQQNKA
jgi:hypothetical protein